jgi:hypothetical protein
MRHDPINVRYSLELTRSLLVSMKYDKSPGECQSLLRKRLRELWPKPYSLGGSATRRLDAEGRAQGPHASETLPHGHTNSSYGMRGRRIPRRDGWEEVGVRQSRPSCRAESGARRTDFAPDGASCSYRSQPSNSLGTWKDFIRRESVLTCGFGVHRVG